VRSSLAAATDAAAKGLHVRLPSSNGRVRAVSLVGVFTDISPGDNRAEEIGVYTDRGSIPLLFHVTLRRRKAPTYITAQSCVTRLAVEWTTRY
jgi:hypothetical protein